MSGWESRSPREAGQALAVDKTSPPRLAPTIAEAAASAGGSDDTSRRYIAPGLPVVRIRRIQLYPGQELERWPPRGAALAAGA